MVKKTIAIVGAGPAALLAASFIDPAKFDLCIYEKNRTAGRKFLVAGKGGLNLSYAEPLEELISKYTVSEFFTAALKTFSNQDLRNYLYKIGINTYVGSSNRIFPEKGIKPIEVLKAILEKVLSQGFEIKYEHAWKSWTKHGDLLFENDVIVKTDFQIFALGGASWKITGSDGNWNSIFRERGIDCHTFEASNCAYQVKWPKAFIDKHEGTPLKNIALSCRDKTIKGELMITRFGLEGAAIYGLSPEIRLALKQTGKVVLSLDLKPLFPKEKLIDKMDRSGKKITEILKRYLKLSKAQIDLIKDQTNRNEFLDPEHLAERIKDIKLEIVGKADIDEAISTVGGIDIKELNSNFELIKMPNHFCIGEMIDYDAPTGGYLLQSCFSMGAYLAQYLNEKENQ